MDKIEVIKQLDAMESEAKKLIDAGQEKADFMFGISDAAATMAGLNLKMAGFILSEAKKRIANIAAYSNLEEEEMKRILDACCGSRMFFFDRLNPDVLYADNRELETTLCDGRQLLIKPDVQMDFRNMPYEDNTFKVVVFDPPHLIHAGTGSWLAKKYGILPKDWSKYLSQGFDECMRVLEPNGLLVFKWNEDQIPLSKVLKEFGQRPLLGDQRGKTRWLIFIK